LSTSHNPLRLNVGFLLNQPLGTYRDFPFDLPGIQLSPEIITRRLLGTLRISRTSEGLLLQGDFKTHIPATCVRCLEDTEQLLHTVFTDLVAFPKIQRYESSSEDEPELVLPDDGYIDLAPLLSEYLLLEIPMKPLCRSDCKGLCPDCGADLNKEACEHISQPAEVYPSVHGLSSPGSASI